MGADVILTKLDWKHCLEMRILIAKDGLRTADFGVNKTLIAGQQLLGIDYVATSQNFIDKSHLDPKSKSFTDQANAINIEAVKEGRDLFEWFLSTVFDLDKTPVEKWAWEEAIENAVQRVKHDSYHVVIGGADKKSMELIDGLPEEARKPASDVFISGFRFLIYFLSLISDQMDEVLKGLYEFLLGIWDRLDRARKAVQQAAESVIQKRISGIYVLSGQAKGNSQTTLHESHTPEEEVDSQGSEARVKLRIELGSAEGKLGRGKQGLRTTI